MPVAVLDKQDPAADTSKNPVLSTTSAHYGDQDAPWRGCLRMLSCGASGGGDASGALIVIAVLAATRRRKTS
jgi:MYXO-CTERM domain-containing protein